MLCEQCGHKMCEHVNSATFRKNGHYIEIPDVTFFQCQCCRNKVFEQAEMQRIKSILKARGYFDN